MWVRILAGTVVGGVVMFFLGWLIYGLLLMNFMKAHAFEYAGLMKEPMPDFIPLVIGNLAWAFMLTFILDYWASIRTFASGLKAGAIIMFPLVLGIDMQYLAFMNMFRDLSAVAVDVIAATIMGAIVAGVIGLVLGFMNKGETAG